MGLNQAGGFQPQLFNDLLKQRKLELGHPLQFKSITGSTNDDALQAARQGAPHGSLFVADQQTHGRGRRGHTWHTPKAQDLTFSVLVRPSLVAAALTGVTLAVGLAVRDACAKHTVEELSVKWPNDVLCRGRKLAGILLESQLRAGVLSALVIGIGVNVNARTFPPDLQRPATSLALLGAKLGREQLLIEILQALELRLRQYTEAGLPRLLPELERYNALLGSQVVIEDVQGTVQGTVQGLSVDGALLVRDESGQVHPVRAGRVEIVQAALASTDTDSVHPM